MATLESWTQPKTIYNVSAVTQQWVVRVCAIDEFYYAQATQYFYLGIGKPTKKMIRHSFIMSLINKWVNFKVFLELCILNSKGGMQLSVISMIYNHHDELKVWLWWLPLLSYQFRIKKMIKKERKSKHVTRQLINGN